ncbi:unnamed protein product [Peronospora destructor]|uniref:Pentatricopeptide repeat-containing protein n=1 Tax=Peronospora destructor TaxID=86335 RepID=A0AAV0VCA1_9STRA|nr:unnamed protein product [Peronospora destructor]
MAKHKKVKDCAEMLQYFEKQDVFPKPFALLTAFSAFCEARKFDYALDMFETLYKGSVVLKPWVFGWAMDAATVLDRHELVASIFQRLLKVGEKGEEDVAMAASFEVNASKSNVSEMLHHAHERGVPMSEFALRALVSFADKAYKSDLALDAVSMMQDRGLALSSELYSSVLKACGKNERWSDVLDVFEVVPEDMYMELSGSALGSVVMALAKSGDEELIEIGLELFNDHPSKWFGYACNAAMEALLQTRQFDETLALANEMKNYRLKWSSFTYKIVVVALIRKESIEEARQVLHTNAKRMQNDSAACYGELIDHYAQTRGDTVEALYLCEEMLQKNWHIQFTDWCTALNLTHELPHHPASWRVRKQLWLRAESFGQKLEQKIPYNLLVLPERTSTRNQVLPVGGAETTQNSSPVPVDVSFGLEVLNDFRSASGSGLTNIIATKLLEAMANHNRIDDCLKMLDFFEEQKIFLKPTARIAAFRAFCASKEDGQARKVFESMLFDDLALKRQNFSTTLIAAMELERHEVVMNIIDRVRKYGKCISNEDYETIRECFEHDHKWRLTIELLSTLVRDRFS